MGKKSQWGLFEAGSDEFGNNSLCIIGGWMYYIIKTDLHPDWSMFECWRFKHRPQDCVHYRPKLMSKQIPLVCTRWSHDLDRSASWLEGSNFFVWLKELCWKVGVAMEWAYDEDNNYAVGQPGFSHPNYYIHIQGVLWHHSDITFLQQPVHIYVVHLHKAILKQEVVSPDFARAFSMGILTLSRMSLHISMCSSLTKTNS